MHGTALLTVMAIVGAVFLAAGYRVSLSRRPTRNCHRCKGRGWHRGAVWVYAKGPCGQRTMLPPRVQCDGGQVPRWGARVLHIEAKEK
jgi:hypothetical protein